MTNLDPKSMTHWCRGCDAHYQLHQVCHYIPDPRSAAGVLLLNICPTCGSYDVVELKEVTHAQ